MNYKTRKIDEPSEWGRKGSYWYEILGHFQVKAVIDIVHGRSLLDLACGDGFLTVMLSEHFERVVGVDAWEQAIEKARRHCPKATFCASTIEQFDIKEKFDVITMINVMEHVDDPIEVLKKAASFLETEGKLVVQVPNAKATNRRIGQKMGVIDDLYELSDWDIDVAGHKRYYDMDMLTGHLQESGLKVMNKGGFLFKTLSTPQIEWLLQEGPWQSGQFGWGGEDKDEDWRFKFCNALYEMGKEYPEDCNLIYAVAKL